MRNTRIFGLYTSNRFFLPGGRTTVRRLSGCDQMRLEHGSAADSRREAVR
jgi:hypothetical protein